MSVNLKKKIWPMMQWPLIVLLLSLLSLIPLLRQQDSFYFYQPPLTLPPGSYIAGAGTYAKVLVVIVDGMRADQAEKLSLWQERKGRGAWGTLLTRPPSWSDPCFSTIITGAWAEIHSVSSNEFQGKIPVDTISRAAQSVGLTVAFSGDEKWLSLIPNPPDYGFGEDSSADPEGVDLAILEKGLEFLASEPDLLFLHFNQVDHISHLHGVLSAESDKALGQIDDLLARLLSRVDWEKYVLFLISDHGHRVQGGHGGDEKNVLETPLLVLGKGVVPGGPISGNQVDLAPIWAVLLGSPFPAYSLGTPLFSAFAIDEKERALAGLSLLETRVLFARAYSSLRGGSIIEIPELLPGEELKKGEKWAELSNWSEEQLRELDRSIFELREAGLTQERLSRLWAPIAAVLAFLLLILLGRKKGWPLALLDAAVILMLFVLFFTYVFGQTFSFSTLPAGTFLAFFILFALPLFLPALLVFAAIPFQLRRKPAEERLPFAGQVLFSVSFILLVLFSFVYYANGLVSTWHLFDFSIGFLILTVLLLLLFNGVFAILIIPLLYLCWRPRHR